MRKDNSTSYLQILIAFAYGMRIKETVPLQCSYIFDMKIRLTYGNIIWSRSQHPWEWGSFGRIQTTTGLDEVKSGGQIEATFFKIARRMSVLKGFVCIRKRSITIEFEKPIYFSSDAVYQHNWSEYLNRATGNNSHLSKNEIFMVDGSFLQWCFNTPTIPSQWLLSVSPIYTPCLLLCIIALRKVRVSVYLC